MTKYVFTDEFGEHSHEVSQTGRAYDAKKKITCPACKNKILAMREEACEKYGWKVYPTSLLGCLEGE